MRTEHQAVLIDSDFERQTFSSSESSILAETLFWLENKNVRIENAEIKSERQGKLSWNLHIKVHLFVLVYRWTYSHMKLKTVSNFWILPN